MSAPLSAAQMAGASPVAMPADIERAARRVERRQTFSAAMLVLPLIVLIAFAFLIPVGLLLFKSIDNPVVAEGLPEGATVNAETGVLRWTPGPGQAGDYYTTLLVSDGESVTRKTITLRAAPERMPSSSSSASATGNSAKT